MFPKRNSDRHDSKDLQKDTSKAKQNVSKLLLLSMFTIAARYLDDVDTVVNNEKENGTTYLADAQKILSRCRKCRRFLVLCSHAAELHRQGLSIQQDIHNSVPTITWNQGIRNRYVPVLTFVPGVNLRPGSMEQGWLYMAMAKAMVNTTQLLRNVYDSLTTTLSGS